jgi:hypothetical protein
MGLLVQTQFETPEGFSVSSVYLRIAKVILTLTGESSATADILVETFSSELARRKQASLLRVPALPMFSTIETTLSALDFATLYSAVRSTLAAAGFSSTDVLVNTPLPTTMPEASQQSSESTQPTLPTPPPPEESQDA